MTFRSFVVEIYICHILAVWRCSFAENYIPLIMKNKEYTHLREQVQKIEEKILAITGRNVDFNIEWTRSQRKYEQVGKLIWKRKHLLDEMFVAMPEEVCVWSS